MENIEQMIRNLLVKGGQIASINTSHRKHIVETKLYKRTGLFLLLPGVGFSVATDYNQLAKNISELVGDMANSLSQLQEEDRTVITVTEEIAVPVTGADSLSNSYHSLLTLSNIE
jgi:uncharacterized protein YjhX (UPF0386 family)